MALTKDDKQFIEMSLAPLLQDMCACKEHLSKINGKVQKHDEIITLALEERARNREHQKAVEDDVKEIKVKVEKHDSELMEYRFFRKYPKAMLYLSLCVVGLVLYEVLDKIMF